MSLFFPVCVQAVVVDYSFSTDRELFDARLGREGIRLTLTPPALPLATLEFLPIVEGTIRFIYILMLRYPPPVCTIQWDAPSHSLSFFVISSFRGNICTIEPLSLVRKKLRNNIASSFKTKQLCS